MLVNEEGLRFDVVVVIVIVVVVVFGRLPGSVFHVQLVISRFAGLFVQFKGRSSLIAMLGQVDPTARISRLLLLLVVLLLLLLLLSGWRDVVVVLTGRLVVAAGGGSSVGRRRRRRGFAVEAVDSASAVAVAVQTASVAGIEASVGVVLVAVVTVVDAARWHVGVVVAISATLRGAGRIQRPRRAVVPVVAVGGRLLLLLLL